MQKLEKFYKNKNVLVTGGAGFIGSHLVDKLVQLQANVTVIDSLSTGTLDNLNLSLNKIKFINADICDFESCINTTKDMNIVFHLAAFISVPLSMQNPKLCNDININGTTNLLEACRINKVNKFVFSSSSAVYGNKETICNEEDPCSPTSIYGYSKLIGEQFCEQYAKLFNLNTVCLRYFNVFGPRQNPNGDYAGVVAKFNYCIEHNLPITIYGDGKQTRDFVEVENVVKANLLAGTTNLKYQVLNVASGKSITLLELYNLLKAKKNNNHNQITFLPARSADIINSIADVNKINKIFNLSSA